MVLIMSLLSFPSLFDATFPAVPMLTGPIDYISFLMLSSLM
jgi:hypothetical protein